MVLKSGRDHCPGTSDFLPWFTDFLLLVAICGAGVAILHKASGRLMNDSTPNSLLTYHLTQRLTKTRTLPTSYARLCFLPLLRKVFPKVPQFCACVLPVW